MSDGLDLAAIRARAEAATPGPWVVGWTGISESWVAFADSDGERGSSSRAITTTREGCHDYTDADAAHIAGMDPATTLALVDELERLRAKIAAVEAEHVVEYPTESDEAHRTNPGCSCGRLSYPCDTRRALAAEVAR